MLVFPQRAAKGREAMRQTHFAARLRVPSCPFVVKPPPHGFVLLRASSWSNLNRKASRSLVAQRALRATKNHSAWSSRSLAALRGQILRRKASCSFVSLRGQHSAARLRASSCLFVVKPPPQGFASLSGPSRTNNSAARLRVPSCPFVVKANSTARQEPLSGKTNPGKHVLQHISPKFPPKTLATPQKAPIFASRAAASGPTFGGTETTFPLPTTEKNKEERK